MTILNSDNLHWTKPYYGVQHLKGHEFLDAKGNRQAQITVTNFDPAVAQGGTLQRWVRWDGGMKAIGNAVYFQDMDEARAEGERWFKERFLARWT